MSCQDTSARLSDTPTALVLDGAFICAAAEAPAAVASMTNAMTAQITGAAKFERHRRRLMVASP
ncbi:MAG: hypothetical protein DMD84_29315 [Candidatus Rokuibacteriota bacterium]|nr:MAG: hypothetical protein DMD84_29315 [Candidatus Rokubacteria bacterium]